MKFQKLEVFEKHFKEAFPKHLSSIYVVICPRESERKKIMATLIHLLESQSDLKRCPSMKEAVEHLSGGSLFSQKVAAAFDGLEQLLDHELELLTRYIQAPNPEGCLLIGATNAKQILDLYAKGKKEMVVLDLSLEKPWEEKDRIQKWVVQTVAAKKKKIDPDALKAFLHLLPSDRFLLEAELEKLTCYLGERDQISLKDIELLCASSLDQNPFELAREIVWEHYLAPTEISDLSLLLSLVAQLRAQFEMGLKVGALLKKWATTEEISAHFPRLWPKALQQCLEGVRKKGADFFKNGLIAVFDLEWGLKTSFGRPEVLFTIFCSKIQKPL